MTMVIINVMMVQCKRKIKRKKEYKKAEKKIITIIK